jgi:hypothetical protein
MIATRRNALLISLLAVGVLAASQLSAAESVVSAGNLQPARKLNSKQAEEMHARIELADTILRHVEADANQKGASSDWRIGLLSSLYATKSQDLQVIASTATTLDAAHGMAASAHRHASSSGDVPKSLGSATDNLVFTPVTPCRYIDTRNVGGPITTPRDFDTVISGPTYGGASGCSIPATAATDIAVNVTVVVPAGTAGYIGLRPYGSTALTSFINWPAEGTPGLANAGIIGTAFNAADSSNEFEAFAGGGNSPQMIMDYFGYFGAAASPALTPNCYVAAQRTFTTSNTPAYEEFSNVCTQSGYLPAAPYCFATPPSQTDAPQSGFFGNINNPNGVYCQFNNTGGQSKTIVIGALCCSTAGSP